MTLRYLYQTALIPQSATNVIRGDDASLPASYPSETVPAVISARLENQQTSSSQNFTTITLADDTSPDPQTGGNTIVPGLPFHIDYQGVVIVDTGGGKLLFGKSCRGGFQKW